jgi:hypothetical protein
MLTRYWITFERPEGSPHLGGDFLRLFFIVLAPVLMLGTAASCAAQQEDDVTTYSSSASEIIFPDGSTIPVDFPMPTKELMDKVEEKGGSYEIHRRIPPSGGVDADRAYSIYAGYDPEDQVKRDYFAYEKDDMIVYLRKSFGLENPYPRWWNVFSWFSG